MQLAALRLVMPCDHISTVHIVSVNQIADIATVPGRGNALKVPHGGRYIGPWHDTSVLGEIMQNSNINLTC